jgi:hypothetical protein
LGLRAPFDCLRVKGEGGAEGRKASEWLEIRKTGPRNGLRPERFLTPERRGIRNDLFLRKAEDTKAKRHASEWLAPGGIPHPLEFGGFGMTVLE